MRGGEEQGVPAEAESRREASTWAGESAAWTEYRRLRSSSKTAALDYLRARVPVGWPPGFEASPPKEDLGAQGVWLRALAGKLSNRALFILGCFIVLEIEASIGREEMLSPEVRRYMLDRDAPAPGQFGSMQQHVFPVDDTVRQLLHRQGRWSCTRARKAARSLLSLHCTAKVFGVEEALGLACERLVLHGHHEFT